MTGRPHRTRVALVTTTDGLEHYLWRCTCGHYSYVSGKTYRIASAEAAYHRRSVRRLQAANAQV